KRWVEWSQVARDIGAQTRKVLGQAGVLGAAGARDAARALHDQTGRTAGNGALMRTSPVSLAYLDDAAAMTDAARSLSVLTHFDPAAGDACVLWCHAIRHAVLTGELDIRVGIEWLPVPKRSWWSGLLNGAETAHPRDFTRNGWVVEALQGAWCAI